MYHELRKRGTRAMRRVFIVTGCWFLFWMGAGAIIGIRSNGLEGFFSGATNGAWIATLLSFTWPWIMPDALERWMDG